MTHPPLPYPVATIGEFDLIERLHRVLDSSPRRDVLHGIGDDTAVLGTGDPLWLATVDSHVDGVHFLSPIITPEQLGWRAMAVNLSDIAAMGGQALYALIALLLPPETDVAWLERVYRGVQQAATQYGVAIVGGNISRLPERVVLDVTVIGQVRRTQLLLRAGAQVGDLVLVTGDLGAGAAGLLVAREHLDGAGALHTALSACEREALLLRYVKPTPRLPEAAIIAASGSATAMLDVSDGLSSDMGHICQQSGVGVRLDSTALPLAPLTRRAAHAVGRSPLDLALAGGDDYELCFTVAAPAAPALIAAVQGATGTPVTIIGEIVPAAHGRSIVLDDGQPVALDARGWQHFQG